MKKLLLLLCVFCIFAYAKAQQANPDWSFPVEGKPEKIFVHNFTGVPVVKTSAFYYGVNYIAGEVLWKFEKINDVFEEIPLTPFATVNNMFVNAETGKILFGADSATKVLSIEETNIIPETFVLLVKANSPNRIVKLHCIDLEKSELMWSIDLEKESVMKNLGKITGISSFGLYNAFEPKITSTKDIVYKHGKKLYLINSKNGSIIWENECNPGTFFMDDKEEHLIAVDQSGGLLSLSTSSFGKKVSAIDLKTGKNLWKKPVEIADNFIKQIQVDAESVLIAGKDGFNIYKYSTGEKLWKKDYEAKKLKDVTVEEEGYEVFYGNKTMLVDKATGKNLWKKPFEMDLDDEDNDVSKKEYKKGYLILSAEFARFVDKVKGKSIWRLNFGKDAKIAFDDKNKKVAILDWKRFYLFNPDELTKKPESIKVDIENPKEIYLFETRNKGYFVQGINEYFFIDNNGELLAHKYFKQLATDRLERTLLTVGSIGAGIMSTEITVSDGSGNSTTFGAFTSNTKQYAEASKHMSGTVAKLKQQAKLRNASKTTNDFAYFISGERKDGQDFLSLVKVDKNTGEEIKSFNMGNNRKIIYELVSNINMAFVIIGEKLAAYNL
ncbi:MAG: PQQ-binding-like beta-propeller repeat protein [Prevotellaceae bacterium]|jgi:outer membrane protein assembly factor BamB|nr:PQQ-binding-like beta-propeller repeat protein [Prevotellaceae bacterium]